MKQSLQTDKSEAKVEEKWALGKKDSVMKKDTEKWVEEQNEFFKKKKEKQKEGVPVKFEPRGPIKILHRKKYTSTTILNQAPRRPRNSRYSKGQPSYWVTKYEGARYEMESGAGYNPREKKWPQGNGYRKRYGTGREKETGKSYKSNGTQSQTYYTTQGPRGNGKYLPAKGPGNGQDGSGEDEGRDDKKKFRNTKYDFEDKEEEKGNTEDSYELEISPKTAEPDDTWRRGIKYKIVKEKSN